MKQYLAPTFLILVLFPAFFLAHISLNAQNIDSVVMAADGIMVGIGKNSAAHQEITIFPNPASNHALLISKGKVTVPIEYDITDITGKIVFSKNNAKKRNGKIKFQLPIKQLQSGTFFVRLFQNGNVFAVKRLIISH